MRETILRPYRIIYLSLLIRIIVFSTGLAFLVVSGLVENLDYAGSFRITRVVTYLNSVAMLLTGLAVFFALTELSASSDWFAKAAILFVIESAIHALSDAASALFEVLSSRAPFSSVNAAVAAVYSVLLAASLIAPVFLDYFMYGHLLRGYQEVCGTFGRDGEDCRRLIRRIRVSCSLLLVGMSGVLLAYTLWVTGADMMSGFMVILAAVTFLSLAVGGVMRAVVQLRILRMTRVIQNLVAEISF